MYLYHDCACTRGLYGGPESRATIHIEAPITLDEEEFEVLAHTTRIGACANGVALSVLVDDPTEETSVRRLYYHQARLNELIAGVLGHEAVQRISMRLDKKGGLAERTRRRFNQPHRRHERSQVFRVSVHARSDWQTPSERTSADA